MAKRKSGKRTKSYLVQIHEGEHAPKTLRLSEWMLWTNCRDMDDCRNVALSQHMRFRGGVSHAFTVRIYVSRADDVGPDGNPTTTHVTEYLVEPNRQEAPEAPYGVNWARDRLKGAQGDQ